MHEFRIRIAEAEDAEPLASIGARLFVQTYTASHDAADIADYTRASFSPARQRIELDDYRCRYLIVERADRGRANQQEAADNTDSEPAGYALLRLGPAPPGVPGEYPVEIARLYLDRALHGQGVASLLMARCLAEAGAWNGDSVWLSVWEHNHRAIRFYERWGFVRVGAQPFRFGSIDEMDPIMARPLA